MPSTNNLAFVIIKVDYFFQRKEGYFMIEFFNMSPTYTITKQQRPAEPTELPQTKNNTAEKTQQPEKKLENDKRFDTLEVEKENKDDKDDKDNKECRTCAKRRYQDGSNDPSVSFKTPTKLSPDRAAAAVRNHEMQHVFHEQANAKREGREVVSQSVVYHTGICPECHRLYVAGGQTRTVTRAKREVDTGQLSPKGKLLNAGI